MKIAVVILSIVVFILIGAFAHLNNRVGWLYHQEMKRWKSESATEQPITAEYEKKQADIKWAKEQFLGWAENYDGGCKRTIPYYPKQLEQVHINFEMAALYYCCVAHDGYTAPISSELVSHGYTCANGVWRKLVNDPNTKRPFHKINPDQAWRWMP